MGGAASNANSTPTTVHIVTKTPSPTANEKPAVEEKVKSPVSAPHKLSDNNYLSEPTKDTHAVPDKRSSSGIISNNDITRSQSAYMDDRSTQQKQLANQKPKPKSASNLLSRNVFERNFQTEAQDAALLVALSRERLTQQKTRMKKACSQQITSSAV